MNSIIVKVNITYVQEPENEYENTVKRTSHLPSTKSGGGQTSLQYRRSRSRRQPLREEDALTLTPKSSLRWSS